MGHGRCPMMMSMLAICHTDFSLQAGVRSPEDWVAAAVERGYSSLAIADVNGLYGAVRFYQCALAAGLQPIIGAELWVDGCLSFIALVRSQRGYRQLCRLLSRQHLHPRELVFDWLSADAVDDLFLLARSPACLQRLASVVGPDRLFALPRDDWPGRGGTLWDALPQPAPIAPIPDAWFIQEADPLTFRDLAALRGRKATTAGPGAVNHPGVVLPEANAWRQQWPDISSSEQIVEECTFEFALGVTHLPRLTLPDTQAPEAYLQHLCREQLPNRYQADLMPMAEARLATELAVIAPSGFADYFLYVNEIIGFARQRRIPVEVRGSAASSIVAYLLGFTHCCPLEHDLYFERFMNPGRRDCPDIDVDIADNRRDEVISFCYDRWGEERVAMVATVLTYRSPSALRDAARILGLPMTLLPDLERGRRDPDAYPELFRTAGRLIGHPRHLGVHCGGLIITPFPLTDITPLTRARKGVVMTHYEKDQAAAIGLVKMDLLGNTALSVIDAAEQWLQRSRQPLPEVGPRYDFKVNRLFAAGDTLGIYQCESPGMRQLCRALKPTTPKQVATTLSLIRPGPAAAGMKEAFIRRKQGLEPVTYLHPRMASFLSATYGVMLYQEDVMKVAVNLAGYTLADADNLRRAVKQRDSGAFAEERHRFVFTKAPAAGIAEDVADQIWNQVTRFASYSYCKAHASVYSRLAWITARLKVHHPKVFYAAILNHHKSMYPTRVFVWDALRHQVPVLPPSIHQPSLQWQPVEQGVRAGLTIVHGLRNQACRAICQQRRRRPFRSLADLRARVSFQAGELERLILVGACRELGDRETLLGELAGAGRHARQRPLFRPHHRSGADLPSLFEAEWELTGIPFSRHPVQGVVAGGCLARELPNFVNRRVSLVGILDAVKPLQTAKGADGERREMSFLTLEDVSGLFEAVLFPEAHVRYGHLFHHVGPFEIHGTVSCQWNSLSVAVERVVSVERRGKS